MLRWHYIILGVTALDTGVKGTPVSNTYGHRCPVFYTPCRATMKELQGSGKRQWGTQNGLMILEYIPFHLYKENAH